MRMYVAEDLSAEKGLSFLHFLLYPGIVSSLNLFLFPVCGLLFLSWPNMFNSEMTSISVKSFGIT